MAKRPSKKEERKLRSLSYDRALRIAAKKLKPVLDELREYDLKHGT